VHFLVDELLAALILAVGLALATPVVRFVIPSVVSSTLELQPSWLVLVEGLFVAEVAGYWGHRASHEIGALWRFHQLHHSIETMDWLAPNRRHPVDMAFARASVILPLLVLGFTIPAIAAPFAIKRFQGLLVHANLRLDAGPITWLIATPEFHHWHHADHEAARNKNYAGQLPIVDWMFGTLHLPRPAWPSRYGCGVTPPEGYLAQLLWPFRRKEPQACTSDNGRSAAFAVGFGPWDHHSEQGG
jgi:sterol desaturase/sphingolipid hydroxylase (fatty acid hydroxylase superfamily)